MNSHAKAVTTRKRYKNKSNSGRYPCNYSSNSHSAADTMKHQVKFFSMDNLLPWVFGHRYSLYTVDEYGHKDQAPSEEVETKMYRYMKDHGFNVKWKLGTRYGFMVLVIRGKAEEAQLALINSGVIEVEVVPHELPVFKI